MNKPLDKLTRAIDRIISGSLGKQILFFIFLAAVVFSILFAARMILFPRLPETPADRTFWNTVHNFINSGGFEHLNGNERLLVFLTNIFGMVMFAGILVALFTNTIYQRIARIRNGEIYYSYNDHVVVIGYDHICDELIEQHARKDELVLQTSDDVGKVRRVLFYNLNGNLRKKVNVVSGNRILLEDIEKLNIHKSKVIYLFGDMNEDAHDSKNIDCLKIIIDILKKTGRKNIPCHVLFKHHSTFAAFERQEISGVREHIDFIPINFYDMWAQKVFVKNKYNGGEIIYTPLDHKAVTAECTRRVHLVILGMSDMGIALGLQAAQICHFPNFITKGIKTRITFIDKEADVKMNSLKFRLRGLFNEIDYSYQYFSENVKNDNKSGKVKFTDIEMEFIKAHFEDDEVQKYLEQTALGETSYLTIAVTLHDSSAALAAALYLPPIVFDSGVSVLVRQEQSHAIVSMLSKEREGDIYRKYKNLRPFGMLNKCYEISKADDLLPMMVKYAYDETRFDVEQTITEFDEKIIRENWENKWKESENMPALKASNRYAANFIPVKQRSLCIKEGVELDREQINLASLIEHNRWVTEKLLVGFRAPTPEEAAEISSDKKKREYYKAKFIHQDIVAFHELGEDIKNINVQIYDTNISRALPYMLKALASNK
ncbi:MAG: hypothetical protein FWB83_08755 [Treponema sp.]|nr:hypothetical protein [Treponema sp.]